MPTYLGKAVPDEYMQGLIGSYRDGQKSAGGNEEDGDQVIIDRLTAEKILTKEAAHALGAADTKAKQG